MFQSAVQQSFGMCFYHHYMEGVQHDLVSLDYLNLLSLVVIEHGKNVQLKRNVVSNQQRHNVISR